MQFLGSSNSFSSCAQEFKKEQLKAQISNLGVLKISGERQLDASRKSKFYKELPVSSNYDTATIHAKFIKGWLQITLPKRKISPKPAAEPSKINDQTPKPDSTKDQSTAAPPISGDAKEQMEAPREGETRGGGAKEQMVAPRKGEPTESAFRVQKRPESGMRLGKVAVSLAATAALIAVLVACVFYMRRSLFGETEV